jgi:serine/threonine protein kinase/Tfp pilus assembly protein PilF
MHDFSAGTRLGHYEILARAGAGAMGEVFRAHDLRLDRIVAIKMLAATLCDDPSRLDRFRREARILASLDHPNIARIYSLEEMEDRAPFLVLEFVQGESLAARLMRGRLSLHDSLAAGVAMASALQVAHACGVIHRDLKPGNVMLTPSGSIKVLDFGLACRRASNSEQTLDSTLGTPGPILGSTLPAGNASATQHGDVLGTLGYMSPEQAMGQAVDQRADAWSFGCVLFECLAGKRAFSGETFADLAAATLERQPRWTELPSVPPRLLDLLRRCLRKDPAERASDLGALANDLRALVAERRGANGVSGSDSVSSSPALPSVAVLDFENLSSDSDLEYFCAGITEDIVTDLSRIRGLRVASRSAVRRLRGAGLESSRLAAELDVGSVLQGSVRRAGTRVRITSQLVSAADSFHIWADRYDRDLQDVFAVQEEIASSIAFALRGALSPAESAALRPDRPGDVRAYDLYLKGRHLYRRYTADSLRQALRLFEQAVGIDPRYALAWAGIADCHGQMLQFEMAVDRNEAIRRGLEAARRSVALNSAIAEGHKSEALILLYTDKEASKAALRRALEANPRHIPALINLASLLLGDADVAGAERLLRRAVATDPHDEGPLEWLSKLAFWTGRFEEALALIERRQSATSEPRALVDMQVLRASICLRTGDMSGAAREVSTAEGDVPDPELQAVLAVIAARVGKIGEARSALQIFGKARGANDQAHLLAMEAALRCGETDTAYKLFCRPVISWGRRFLVRIHPELRSLLDMEAFGPPRIDLTLVWPAEALLPEDSIRTLFSAWRVENGRP